MAAALAGAGVAMLPVAFALGASELVELPLPAPLPTRQPWLIVHRDQRSLASVKLVQKWVVKAFGGFTGPRQAPPTTRSADSQ
jgi:DNA-binding transcriptional LysR family regulator